MPAFAHPHVKGRVRGSVRTSGAAALIACCLALTAGACSNDKASQDTYATIAPSDLASKVSAEPAPAMSPAFDESQGGQSGTTERDNITVVTVNAVSRRDVIYQANISLLVKSATQSATAIIKAANARGGFVFSDTREGESATLTLKLPPKEFDAFISSVAKVGKVLNRTVTANDVTAQAVDLEAQLKTAQASRDRLRTMLTQAQAVKDIIAIEAELQTRESMVEQLQGQLNVLRSQVGLATVTVQLNSEVVTVIDTPSNPGFLDGIKSGWSNVQEFLSWLGHTSGFLLPFLPVFLIAAFAIRAIGRRSNRKSSSVTSLEKVPNVPADHLVAPPATEKPEDR